MGSRHAMTKAEKLLADKREEEIKNAVKRERMALSDKIVMVVIDQITRDIIRPGPIAEERECYDMAKELHDHSGKLSKLVSEVLRVHKEEDN